MTTRLEALAHNQGYALCRWTVDTYDWDGPSADQMVERITYGDYRSPPIHAGGNILMHGAGTNTAAGLQRIIDAVRSKGLTLEARMSAGYDPNGPEGTIYRLYRAYFLREPDAGGFEYWNGVYIMGYPLDAISNDFARSTEFQSRYGDVDSRRFLDLVYANVLDRAPDQDGYDYWVDQMNRGMSRGFVMIYFSESEEFRTETAAGTPPGYT